MYAILRILPLAALALLAGTAIPTSAAAMDGDALPLKKGRYDGKTVTHSAGYTFNGKLTLIVTDVSPTGKVKAVSRVPGTPGEVKLTGTLKADGTLTLSGKHTQEIGGTEVVSVIKGTARVKGKKIKGRFEIAMEVYGQPADIAVDFDLELKEADEDE